MKVKVNIERLVLRGFAPHQRDRIGDAVRSELERLLMERGVPASLKQRSSVAGLDAGSVELGRETPARTVGNRVARAVDRGWRRGTP